MRPMTSSRERPVRRRAVAGLRVYAAPAALVAALTLATGVACREATSASAVAPDTAPVRIVLGWAGDPAISQAVTWRTATLFSRRRPRFALAAPGCGGAAGRHCEPWRPHRARWPRPPAQRDALQGRVQRAGAGHKVRLPRRQLPQRPANGIASPRRRRGRSRSGSSTWATPSGASGSGGRSSCARRSPPRRMPASSRTPATCWTTGTTTASGVHGCRAWGQGPPRRPAVPAPGNHDVIRSKLKRVFACA